MMLSRVAAHTGAEAPQIHKQWLDRLDLTDAEKSDFRATFSEVVQWVLEEDAADVSSERSVKTLREVQEYRVKHGRFPILEAGRCMPRWSLGFCDILISVCRFVMRYVSFSGPLRTPAKHVFGRFVMR